MRHNLGLLWCGGTIAVFILVCLGMLENRANFTTLWRNASRWARLAYVLFIVPTCFVFWPVMFWAFIEKGLPFQTRDSARCGLRIVIPFFGVRREPATGFTHDVHSAYPKPLYRKIMNHLLPSHCAPVPGKEICSVAVIQGTCLRCGQKNAHSSAGCLGAGMTTEDQMREANAQYWRRGCR
jgi:hypothetical protein